MGRVLGFVIDQDHTSHLRLLSDHASAGGSTCSSCCCVRRGSGCLARRARRVPFGVSSFFVVTRSLPDPLLSLSAASACPGATRRGGGVLVYVVVRRSCIVFSLPSGSRWALVRLSHMPACGCSRDLHRVRARFRLIPLVFNGDRHLPLFRARHLSPDNSCSRWSVCRCLRRPIWRRWCAPDWPAIPEGSTRGRDGGWAGLLENDCCLFFCRSPQITPSRILTPPSACSRPTLVVIVGIFFDFPDAPSRRRAAIRIG